LIADGSMFIELGIVVIIAAFAAYILRLIKQPQILSYVLVGIIITPVLGIVTNTSIIESMSVIGIAFLLFIVGLEMDIKSLKNVALVSSFGGMIQIIIVAVLGYLVALVTGFIGLEAAYIGLMLAFSSTMVVMKLLSDKRELQTMHGRLAIGILLMQDIVAIFAISVLTAVNGFSIQLFGIALVKFVAMFLVAYLASRYVFPYVFRFAARHQELLLISSLGVCFMFALAFYVLGFSVAIGAFIAGIALGNLKYSVEIAGKVRSLKDFFSLLFFVSLGMGISLAVLEDMWIHLIVLVMAVIILKPFVIMVIFSLFKYTKRPSFVTAGALAQIGEFSLILAAQGLLLGHISQELFSLTVLVTIISITTTSYFIQHSNFFYDVLKYPLKIFDLFTTEGLEYLPTEVKPKIILCGYNRIGYSILQGLKKKKKKILIVDFNPEVIADVVKQGYHSIYGEVADEEVINRMNLRHISMLISTVPRLQDNTLLIRKTREVNKRAKIIVTAMDIEHALKLYKMGADYVVMPHFLGGEHVSGIIESVRNKKIKLHEEKKRHIEHLEDRKDMGHKHPKNH